MILVRRQAMPFDSTNLLPLLEVLLAQCRMSTTAVKAEPVPRPENL